MADKSKSDKILETVEQQQRDARKDFGGRGLSLPLPAPPQEERKPLPNPSVADHARQVQNDPNASPEQREASRKYLERNAQYRGNPFT